ncbi:MAG: hypothetical protein HQL69_02475 [Magnetococcales bacterium]|nr:hypothetical protein [Magnetococcales bacterium]
MGGFFQFVSEVLVSYCLNFWSLAVGLAVYIVIINHYSSTGGQIAASSEDALFYREDGRFVHYTTITQLSISTVLFLAIFFYFPSDITLSFSLIAILLSVYLFLDKNLSWSVAKTNSYTADLLQQVRQLQGVESLPNMTAILSKIINVLHNTKINLGRNGTPEIYLICASPAIGAIHENTEVRGLSKTYQVAIHDIAVEIGKNLRVVHYDIEDSLKQFAELAGLDNTKMDEFLKSAKLVSDTLAGNEAAVKIKTIEKSIAKKIFTPQEVPSVMLFHMLVVKHVGGKAELVLWHVEHNISASSSSRQSLSIHGFWTTNQQIIQPFEDTAKQYY